MSSRVLTTALLVLLAIPALAHADVRLALLPFTGEGAAAIEAKLATATVPAGITVIAPDETELAATKLDVTLDDDAGRAAVARTLDVSLFVGGAVRKEGRRWILALTVRDGPTGAHLTEHELSAPDPALLKRNLRSQLAAVLVEDIRRAEKPGINRHVVVADFSGMEARRVRTAAIDALSRRRGLVVLSVEAAGAGEEAVVRAARELGADAVLTGSVTHDGELWKLAAHVVSCADGAATGDTTLSARTLEELESQADGRLWRDLHQSFAQSIRAFKKEDVRSRPVVRAAAATHDTAEPSLEHHARATVSSGKAGRQWLDLQLSGGAMTRELRFVDDLNGGLRDYRLRSGMVIDGELLWYPAALFGRGWLSHVAVAVSGEDAMGLRSEVDGATLETSAFELQLGGRLRFPLGRHEIGLSSSYGRHAFEIQTDTSTPNSRYVFVRGGADARFAITHRLGLALEASWRHLLSMGDIGSADWFPRSSSRAIDGKLAIHYRAGSALDLVLSAQLRRYVFYFNPEPGDDNVAGGAVDQSLGVFLGIGFTPRM